MFTEVAVNLEIGMERMRLDLRKSSLYAANRTRVPRRELQRCILESHVLPFPAG